MLGLQGLGTSGGFERLHYLLESAFDGPDLSMAFMKVTLLLPGPAYQEQLLENLLTGSLGISGIQFQKSPLSVR